ncbi:MAG: DUF5683 domain-containing protein [Dysgonomonas sp.]
MGKSFSIFILFVFIALYARGQENDSIRVERKTERDSSLITIKEESLKIGGNTNIEKTPFKPNPTRAVIYSAIFPGLGQIYNRKYWKLPIIYGGFIALTYGISWNGGYYNDYSDAYRGISAENPRLQSNFAKWGPMLRRPNLNPNDISQSEIELFKSQFKRKKDFYRRNRDLCIIGMVAVYAVCMIDAYVDAQLFDFDISPDLSLKVEPTVMQSTVTSPEKSFGVQCSVKF